MARGYTKEENEFNECIKMYGNYPTFKYTEFDTIKELKDMFHFFLNNIKKPKINSFRILENMLNEYYEKNNLPLIEKYSGKIRDGENTCDLFQITNLPLGISLYSDKYRGMKRVSHGYITNKTKKKLLKEHQEREEKKKEEHLNKYKIEKEASENKQKIKDWHLYCIAVNKAKLFINKRYKEKWEHDTIGKDKTYNKIKLLANDLQQIDDNLIFDVLYEIGNNKIQLNKINSMKAKKLLSLNLPNIDTLSIANKVTKSLISPYL